MYTYPPILIKKVLPKSKVLLENSTSIDHRSKMWTIKDWFEKGVIDSHCVRVNQKGSSPKLIHHELINKWFALELS